MNNQVQMPMPQLRGQEIIGVSKDAKNTIMSFHLADSSEVSYGEAITLITSGQSSGLNLGSAVDGSMVIRGVADGDPSNNLDRLPVM